MLNQSKTKTAYESNWSFDRYNEWPSKYTKCGKNAKTTCPINIDLNDISPCRALCKFAMKYAPSGCNATIKNNMPTIIFDPTCIIKFRSEFFYLRKMTIHYPSMHTINGEYYDLEVLLYHNRNKASDADGGVIVSILFKKGDDFGPVNEFFNEFINQVPANEAPEGSSEVEIPVSENWNPEKLFPQNKSFFWYEGALPFPPCSSNWNIVVFEEIQGVSQNIIDTVRFVIGTDNKNNRGIQKKPPTVTVLYNSDINLSSSEEISTVRDQTQELIVSELEAAKRSSFIQRNYLYIKGILLVIIVILMVYVAIKLAKYIVAHDLLNKFVIEQVIKRNKRIMEQQKQEAIESGQAGGTPPGGMSMNMSGMNMSGLGMNASGAINMSALLSGAAPATSLPSAPSPSPSQAIGINPLKM